MTIKTNLLSYVPNRRGVAAGVLTIVGIVGIGFGAGLATGVINVPFAEACCVIVPPTPTPPPPPPPPVVPVPLTVAPTCDLSASPTTLPLGGGASTLSWSTVAATSATIDNGVGNVAVDSGTKGVTITSTKTYTMTVNGPGGSTTCHTTIVVTPPPAPTCTLSASPTTIASGDSSTLSWTTTNADSFTIDHSVGSVTPVTAGTASVSPTVTTTYTGTAVGNGQTVHCTAKVTVTTVTNAPTCTLTANPTTISKGSASLLSWTTTNAKSFSIDHLIGSVTPVAAGSQSVSPITTTTYTGTATDDNGVQVHCTATVTVTTPNPSDPSCTLTASPTKVNAGDHTTLTWTTTNGNMFSIDQGIGDVTPVSGGSVSSKAINGDTTFTGTVTSPTGFVATCTAVVTINGGGSGGGPTCTMTVSPSSIRSGNSATLSWGGSDILSVDIDNGIATATTSPGSTTVAPTAVGTHKYTGTFHANNGQTLTCSATLTIEGGSGGCTSNCGGGSNPPPTVVLASLPHVGSQPFVSYLYLSQVPYTGLDLGFWGTILYWTLLVVWSIALAYLVLFGAVPYIARAGRAFGERVSEMVNAVEVRQTVPQVPVEPRASVVTREEPVMREEAPEAPQSYSTYDGFKSFATSEALSIEDIVKGLARSTAQAIHRESHDVSPEHAQVEPIYDRVEPIAENVEPIYDNVEPIEEPVVTAAPRTRTQRAPEAPAPVAAEVPAFLEALLCGNRDEVFSMTREVVRSGGSSEAFLTQATCALDDAYRARLEGTPVHKDIEKITAGIATPVLERVVTALSTAVDSSYSVGITGAKVALTRALAVLGA